MIGIHAARERSGLGSASALEEDERRRRETILALLSEADFTVEELTTAHDEAFDACEELLAEFRGRAVGR